MKNVRTPKYDLTGNGFFRVFRFNMLNKVIPTGNFRQGTGFKPALILLFLHWFGRPLFRVLIRYEAQLHRLYQKLKKN